MEPNFIADFETHHLFSSGEWEGFYLYPWSNHKHMMYFDLVFKNGEVAGGGMDGIASFRWIGSYDTKNLTCNMVKHYASHTVMYRGMVDENGIWGRWNIGSHIWGGFHLWPKSNADEKMANEVSQEEVPQQCLLHD